MTADARSQRPKTAQRATLVATAAVLAALALAFAPRRQEGEYHRFADAHEVFGIPNGADVLSNLGFLAAGLAGLVWAARAPSDGDRAVTPSERSAWRLLALAVAATAVGSAYYHLAPDDGRLFWDRLPMTVVFGTLLSVVLAERVDARLGARLLAPIVLFAVGSAVYWRLADDLRPYVFAQYGTVALVGLVLLLFPERREGSTRRLLAALVLYAAAKGAERFDFQLLALSGLVSGHTLKHLLACGATVAVLRVPSGRRLAS